MSGEEAGRLLVAPGVSGRLSPNGFVLARVAADEAEILWIGVALASRRGGQGAELLRSALADLRVRGARRVFLEVSEHNAPAIGLYSSAGFVEVARRLDYYCQGDDALVLELHFT